MDDISNAISQLQNMLSTDDGKKNLENMIGSFGGIGPSDAGVPDFGPSNNGMINPDSIAKMRTVMDTLQRHDDPRSQLLLALKPYLSASRGARIDTAIMLLSLGKIPVIMKNIRG